MLVQNNKQDLSSYLPVNSVEKVREWLNPPSVQLKITKYRSSKLGDYRPLRGGSSHLITINGSLNKYSFLLTMVHEIAHMHNFITHKGRVKPHGLEWKRVFQLLMSSFDMESLFPKELLPSIQKYLQNPKASSSSDLQLSLALRHYDPGYESSVVLSDIKMDTLFVTRNGRTFIKGARQRKRYKCKEVKTGRLYLFNPITEVLPA